MDSNTFWREAPTVVMLVVVKVINTSHLPQANAADVIVDAYRRKFEKQ